MEDDSPRFFVLSFSLAVACALSWLLMGGAEMVAAMAEQQGAGTAAVITGGGFVAWSVVLYGATRLFHWTWTGSSGERS